MYMYIMTPAVNLTQGVLPFTAVMVARSLSRRWFRAGRANPSQTETVEESPITAPKTQRALILHGPRRPYELSNSHPVPDLKKDSEVLIRTYVIGLNPIDWKAP